MKKKIKIAGAALAAVLIVVVASKLLQKPEGEIVAVLPVVETVTPQNKTIQLYTELTGAVEPEEVVYIYPEAGGTVTEISVKAGDAVTAGQPLCVIDTKQVEGAKNALESAELTMQEAQVQLSRQQVLHQTGAISQQEYENYVNTAGRAKLAFEKAKLDYENQLSYSRITAPISGRVETCDIEVFDKVSPSMQICVISGDGNKIISSGLTEQLKDAVQAGDEIWAEKSGEAYTGTIFEISSMADPGNGLYKMKARMQEGNPLSTGSVVKISFVSEKAENVMTVPVDSVYYDNGEPYVYTYENGTVHKMMIETGIYDSDSMEIRSGLTGGEQIIITWSPELYEGARVELKSVEEEEQAESKTTEGEAEE